MSRVAVAILNWNGSALLRRFLPSVLEHSILDGVPQPVYVIDNGSSDDSIKVLRSEFPQVRILPLDGNYGFSGGYNRALRVLDYEYVLLLNSDVRTSEGYLQRLTDYMDMDPLLAACQPKILSLKSPGCFEYAGAAGGMLDVLGYPFCRGRVFETLEEDRGQYDRPCEVFWASGAALMVRRDRYLEAGGLDEDFFAHMEEIDLCWRFRQRGWRIGCQPQSRVWHLGGATLAKANPRKTYLNFRNNLLMLYKNLTFRRLCWLLPLRFLLDGLAAAVFLARGEMRAAWAVVRATWGFWRMTARVRPARRKNLRERVRCSSGGWTSKSILVEYHLLRHRTFSAMGI